jgi:hypothetical protein
MARGRMISKTLGHSRKYAALGEQAGKLGEFAQALYPMLVSHCDDFGRQTGDPYTVKLAVWPSSSRKEADFVSALKSMHKVGLIEWYEAEGQQFIEVSNFGKHQVGLHKATKSHFPEPSGKFPEFRESPTQLNRTELNLTKPIRSPETPVTAEADEDLATGVTGADISAFLRAFCDLYSKHRFGAKYLVRRQIDVPLVKRLLAVYDAPRLEMLATVLLTTDNEWVSTTDRGIGILSTKAAWLDGLLAEHEARRRGVA